MSSSQPAAEGKFVKQKLPEIERNFVGAIKLAIWLKKHHFYVHNERNVADGSVHPAFTNCVNQYHPGKQIDIYFREDISSTSVVLAYSGGFDILIPASFNTCFRRFALCKELCHILTDDVSVRTDNILDQLESTAFRTVYRIQNAQQLGAQNPLFVQEKLSSEDFCFLLALEILIPIKDRSKIMESYAEGIKTFDIASWLRIPEALVKFFIHSGYNQEFRKIVNQHKLLN